MRNGETPQHLISWSPADWATSTVRARSARVGDVGLRTVYFELLNALYMEGGELPADPAKLADNLLLPEKEIARVLPILSKTLGAITIRNGKLSQPRVSKELARCRSLSEKRRASARSRWDANADQTDANGERTQSDAMHGATATAKAQAKATAKAIREVFDYWKEKTGHPGAQLTSDRRKKLATRLSEDDVAGLKVAVDGAVADPFYAGDNETGRKYWDFQNIFRSRDRIEKLQDSARRFVPKPLDHADLGLVKLPPQSKEAAALFEEVKDRLASKMPDHTRRTWIVPCDGRAFENDGTVLIVTCPSDEHAKWLRGVFKDKLKAALHESRPGMLLRPVVREVTP
jgi:uncharacterized protein YdaU (DUF1376 family)